MVIAIEGLIINYERYICKNNKATKPLLVLHGWGRSLAEWIPFAQKISRERDVYLIDLPGFGSSSTPQHPFSLSDYANILRLFSQKLKLESPIVLGHSFGGRVLAKYASDNIVHKAIFVDSGGVEIHTIKTKVIRCYYIPLVRLIKSFIPKTLYKILLPKLSSTDFISAGSMKKTLVKTINEDVVPYLRKITSPALIIWGDRDDTLPMRQAKIFNQNLENSHIRIVWGSDHDPHLSKPDQFVKIIRDFIC